MATQMRTASAQAAGARVAVAPRPRVAKRCVATEAVKEVFMPALSSTMTEGKVRASPGAVPSRKGGLMAPSLTQPPLLRCADCVSGPWAGYAAARARRASDWRGGKQDEGMGDRS
jgi:hypothetical protein